MHTSGHGGSLPCPLVSTQARQQPPPTTWCAVTSTKPRPTSWPVLECKMGWMVPRLSDAREWELPGCGRDASLQEKGVRIFGRNEQSYARHARLRRLTRITTNRMKSKHPFAEYVPENSERLIIGTIPPPRFCKESYIHKNGDVFFYYGSSDNNFWPLIEEVFGTTLEYNDPQIAIEQRKEFLRKHKLGITDIINSCVHLNESAEDKNLTQIEIRDISCTLQNNPQIHTLVYTSEKVKKFINCYFNTYHSMIDPQNKKRQSVKIKGTPYNVLILYSPSPNALRNMSKDGKDGNERRKEQYREFLLEG